MSNDDSEEINNALMIAQNENEQYKIQVEELQRQIEENNLEQRLKFINEIKVIDPEIDITFLESLTLIQLNKFFISLNRVKTSIIKSNSEFTLKQTNTSIFSKFKNIKF